MKSISAPRTMPELGQYVDDCGDRLVVVANFGIERNVGKDYHYAAVQPEKLDRYFVVIGQPKKMGGLDVRERVFGLDGLFEGTDLEDAVRLINPRDRTATLLYEKHDLKIPGEHGQALVPGGACALETRIEVDGKLHVIDGNYVAMGKKDNPTVVITLMNYFANRQGDLYKAFTIDEMLRSLSVGAGRRYGRKLGPRLKLVP